MESDSVSATEARLSAAAAAAAAGSGWDAFLAAVRPRRCRPRHRGLLQGVDMTVVAHHRAGAVGGQAVPGDDDPEVVATSMTSVPEPPGDGHVSPPASSGGTEYRLPR